MRERGLKYQWSSIPAIPALVAPHAGAWIEILIETVRQAPGLPSLPMRERGLKCLRRFDEITNRVAPHAGAWIEI